MAILFFQVLRRAREAFLQGGVGQEMQRGPHRGKYSPQWYKVQVRAYQGEVQSRIEGVQGPPLGTREGGLSEVA